MLLIVFGIIARAEIHEIAHHINTAYIIRSQNVPSLNSIIHYFNLPCIKKIDPQSMIEGYYSMGYSNVRVQRESHVSLEGASRRWIGKEQSP